MHHAIDEGVHRKEVTGQVLIGACPAQLDLTARRARLLVIARAHGRIAQAGVIELGDDRFAQTHADHHRAGKRDGDLGRRHAPHGAAHIDRAGLGAHARRFGVDDELCIANQVAVLEDGVGNATDAMLQHRLQFVELAALQAVAGPKHQLGLATLGVEQVVVAFQGHGMASLQKVTTNSKVSRVAA